ncbi:MAG: tRNA (adenosine(37)-N6)-dimethylallyltransferase MiaA [Sphaerochaetaceae bacterium]
MKSISKRPTSSNAFSHIIFLFGPTGVGKTELLLDLDPQRFSVINADSIQVYRHLDIGSAKASKAVQAAIEHHLIDVKDPWDQFSVGDFISYADKACEHIFAEGKIPIISGGTAYYFKHFLYGLSEAPPSDENVRAKVSAQIEKWGNDWAFKRLNSLDPLSAQRIHPSDMYRVSRALEVYEASGKPLSSFSLPTEARYGMHPLVIGLVRESNLLHRRLSKRIAMMFDEGLEEEIRGLLRMGAEYWWPGLQGIGYKEFFQAMEHGEWSRSIVADQIERNSRFYAKRQMTFFRSFAEVKWMDPADEKEILTEVERYCCS